MLRTAPCQAEDGMVWGEHGQSQCKDNAMVAFIDYGNEETKVGDRHQMPEHQGDRHKLGGQAPERQSLKFCTLVRFGAQCMSPNQPPPPLPAGPPYQPNYNFIFVEVHV